MDRLPPRKTWLPIPLGWLTSLWPRITHYFGFKRKICQVERASKYRFIIHRKTPGITCPALLSSQSGETVVTFGGRWLLNTVQYRSKMNIRSYNIWTSKGSWLLKTSRFTNKMNTNDYKILTSKGRWRLDTSHFTVKMNIWDKNIDTCVTERLKQ